MRSSPAVSVVIPTRGRATFVSKAIASVLDQRYDGEIECLVVFDQSDPFPLTAPASAHRNLRVLKNKRTPGLAGARNTGALAAKGELLAFCDDDDEWLPDKTRLQVEVLLTDARFDVATCGLYVAYGRRRVCRIPSHEVITHRNFLRSRMMEVNPCTILVRRNAFLNVIGLVDEMIPGGHAEDYEWILRASRTKSIIAVRKPLVRIYWHPESWFAGRWRSLASALTYILEKYPEIRTEPQGLARIYGQLAFAYATLGESAVSVAWSQRSLSANWLEPRAYASFLVAMGVIDSKTIMRLLHFVGRGV